MELVLLTAFIRNLRLQAVVDQLRSCGATGMTITKVKGYVY